MTWDVRFANVDGREPVREWLDSLAGKNEFKRAAAVMAIQRVLSVRGTDVCETEWGKNLGRGLYEFRVRHPATTIVGMFPTAEERDQAEKDQPSRGEPPVLLRVFFTTSGRQIILLLSGYDKGREPSGRKQESEIVRARKLIAALRTKG